uniref:Uncharacterized protein n=1 Tax=Anguilla anguilla TaxID=7936 RepID=A0A0E9QXY1_ANGAN
MKYRYSVMSALGRAKLKYLVIRFKRQVQNLSCLLTLKRAASLSEIIIFSRHICQDEQRMLGV